MPVLPKEGEAGDGMREQLAQATKDSQKSGEQQKAKIEHHKANPGE
jgi:hypothetical protein